MARKYDLTALLPERDTLTDGDRVYEFRNARDMGAVDVARATRLQAELTETLARLGRDAGDEQAAKSLERIIDELVRMILPEMPAERVAQLSFGQKNDIVTFWKEGHERQAPGETPADQSARS